MLQVLSEYVVFKSMDGKNDLLCKMPYYVIAILHMDNCILRMITFDCLFSRSKFDISYLSI